MHHGRVILTTRGISDCAPRSINNYTTCLCSKQVYLVTFLKLYNVTSILNLDNFLYLRKKNINNQAFGILQISELLS